MLRRAVCQASAAWQRLTSSPPSHSLQNLVPVEHVGGVVAVGIKLVSARGTRRAALDDWRTAMIQPMVGFAADSLCCCEQRCALAAHRFCHTHTHTATAGQNKNMCNGSCAFMFLSAASSAHPTRMSGGPAMLQNCSIVLLRVRVCTRLFANVCGWCGGCLGWSDVVAGMFAAEVWEVGLQHGEASRLRASASAVPRLGRRPPRARTLRASVAVAVDVPAFCT